MCALVLIQSNIESAFKCTELYIFILNYDPNERNFYKHCPLNYYDEGTALPQSLAS